VFKVAKLSRNRPLETVVCAGLQHLDVVKQLNLPMQKVHSYLRVIFLERFKIVVCDSAVCERICAGSVNMNISLLQ
jgi:hypothetical protein